MIVSGGAARPGGQHCQSEVRTEPCRDTSDRLQPPQLDVGAGGAGTEAVDLVVGSTRAEPTADPDELVESVRQHRRLTLGQAL